jgi:predicted GH43/DUF377 family glycosyl hydrolase
MAAGVRYPEIVEYDATTWAMFYCNPATWNLEYATAPKSDPHNWTKDAVNNPILVEAAKNIRGHAVIKEGSTFHILYDRVGEISYAYGSDLTNLTKYDSGNPVFEGQGSDWEEFVRHPALIKVGSTYHLYYDGRKTSAAGSNGGIGHATSADLITWVRDAGNNPILSPAGGGWENEDVTTPSIAYFNSKYNLFYAGYDGSGAPFPHLIGYATSPGLTGFTRNPSNFVLEPEGVGWEESAITAPSIFQENGNVHIYYSGNNSDGSASSIGYATMVPG